MGEGVDADIGLPYSSRCDDQNSSIPMYLKGCTKPSVPLSRFFRQLRGLTGRGSAGNSAHTWAAWESRSKILDS